MVFFMAQWPKLPPPNSGECRVSTHRVADGVPIPQGEPPGKDVHWGMWKRLVKKACEQGLKIPNLHFFPAFRGISMLDIQGIQGLTLQNFTLKKVRLPRFISKCSRCKAWSFKIWMFKDWMIDASMVKVEDCWRFWRDTCVYIYIY